MPENQTMDPLASMGESLFANKSVLKENYRPDQFPERSDQIEEYAHHMRDAVNGTKPDNIFLYGIAGTGKTDITKWMMDYITGKVNAADESSFEYVYLNCEAADVDNSYQLTIALLNKMRKETDRDIVPETGNPPARVTRWLWEEIDDHLDAEVVTIILDEVDKVGDDEMLYKLPRAGTNENITDTKLSVIGISNDLTFKQNLRPKVISSLGEKEIKFPPYNAGELRRILALRAGNAFRNTEYYANVADYDGDPEDATFTDVDGDGNTIVLDSDVLDDDVIPLCAGLAMDYDGDARKGIDVLKRAGEQAERDGADVVQERHVREGFSELERDMIEDTVEDLPGHEQLSLLAVMLLESQGETPARTKDIFNAYRTVCEILDQETRTLKTIRDDLNELEMLGFLNKDEQNKGRQKEGGRTYTYEMDQDPVKLVEILQELGSKVGWEVDSNIQDPIPDQFMKIVNRSRAASQLELTQF